MTSHTNVAPLLQMCFVMVVIVNSTAGSQTMAITSATTMVMEPTPVEAHLQHNNSRRRGRQRRRRLATTETQKKEKKKSKPDSYPPSPFPPKVFILGAQKGGSSSLMWMMVTHPQLCEGKQKETKYFLQDYNEMMDQKGATFAEMKEGYLSLFRDPKCTQNPNEAYFIDGTPVLHHPEVAGNLDHFYGQLALKDDLKMIVLLREPVARDFSWYQHKIRAFLTGHVTGQGYIASRKGPFAELQTFQETWLPDLEAVRNGTQNRWEIPLDLAGDYLIQLTEYMQFFRRDQVLIMNSNFAFTRTAEFMEVIRQFLGLRPWSKWETDPFPHDDHLGSTLHSEDPDCVLKHVPLLDCGFRDTLAAHYKEANKDLMKWLRQTRKEAPPMEPVFEPFVLNVSCVEDARAALNEVLEADGNRETC